MDKKEYLKLVETIRSHDRHYYLECQPIISDYAYDQLYRKLKEIEAEHPSWILPSSPTQRVGESPSSSFPLIAHGSPMLSLENSYTSEEVERFMERVQKRLGSDQLLWSAELKIDGVAIAVRYERGVYARAVTRGNGREGDDVTANVKTIRSLPLQLFGSNFPELLELRGEVFIKRAIFDAHNAAVKIGWSNPRNAAAGSLKLLNPSEVAERDLSIIFYAVTENRELPIKSQHQLHHYLRELGIPSFSSEEISLCSSLESIMKFANQIESRRHTLSFDIDGIVIKVDALEEWPKLGMTERSPRWAIAYKFSSEQRVTRLIDILLQVGRTGVITPVALLEPIHLAGSKISRASLHNEEELLRKDLQIGDWVVVEKGGNVIPQIVRVERRSPSGVAWSMPLLCPSCGSKLVKSEEEVAVRCPNYNGCKEQKISQLSYFVSKEAMDIDHLGDKLVEQLVEKGVVDKPSDFYKITEEKLSCLDGFKEKSIAHLMKSIEQSKRPTLSRFILALSIRHVGKKTATLLATAFKSIEAIAAASKEEILKIEGIGAKIAEAVVSYFQDHLYRKEIAALLDQGVQPDFVVDNQNGFFANKTFVITGVLEEFSRREAEELICSHGGSIREHVSKNLDYILVGSNPGSKLQAALRLNIASLTEAQFKEMIQFNK